MKIILRCLAATFLMLFSLSAVADDNRRSQGFIMFNAGTLTVGVMQLQFATGQLEAVSIIEQRTLGTLGRADSRTFSTVIQFGFSPEECPAGFPNPVAITEDTVVLTFGDLSQLVGKGQTFVCAGPDGTQGIRGDGRWTSGRGRFTNVTGGEFRVGGAMTPQTSNGQFYSGAGVISGRIER